MARLRNMVETVCTESGTRYKMVTTITEEFDAIGRTLTRIPAEGKPDYVGPFVARPLMGMKLIRGRIVGGAPIITMGDPATFWMAEDDSPIVTTPVVAYDIVVLD